MSNFSIVSTRRDDRPRGTAVPSIAATPASAPLPLDGRGLAVIACWIEVLLVVGIAAIVIVCASLIGSSPWHPAQVILLAPAYGAALGLSGMSGLRYQHCATAPSWYALRSGVNDNLRAASALIVILFLLDDVDSISHVGALALFAAATGAVAILRFVWARWARKKLVGDSMSMSKAAVLGDRRRLSEVEAAGNFFGALKSEGTQVASTLSWSSNSSQAQIDDLINATVAYSRSGSIDAVVLLLGANLTPAERIIEGLMETPLNVFVVPSVSAGIGASGDRQIGGLPAIHIANSPLSHLNGVYKRAFDIFAASILLVLLSPVLLGVAMAIKVVSRGPVFFRQTRHGYGNRHFKVFKFRSMRVLEDGAAFRQATKGDPRITRVGRFIRKTNLDELPQLLNVLLGDMSLVGPRPHPVALNDEFAARIRRFHRRHNIRPGITGWAQVNGHRGETETDEKMQGRIEHDLWYVDNWSFALDLRILLNTVFSPTAYRNAG